MPPPLPADPRPASLNAGAAHPSLPAAGAAPETYPGGTLRLVSEREFPISTTMTGALMRIKPGGLRELHWHPNADEWQYYINGRGRMTVFGSHGRARTEEFGAGDVGYVPQGYGHYIENVGTEDLELSDRAQQRHLPVDLDHRLDGRQPATPARDQFRRAGQHRSRISPSPRPLHAGVICARRDDFSRIIPLQLFVCA